jgi:hypothetical protein
VSDRSDRAPGIDWLAEFPNALAGGPAVRAQAQEGITAAIRDVCWRDEAEVRARLSRAEAQVAAVRAYAADVGLVRVLQVLDGAGTDTVEPVARVSE